jgi:hypothetical protein
MFASCIAYLHTELERLWSFAQSMDGQLIIAAFSCFKLILRQLWRSKRAEAREIAIALATILFLCACAELRQIGLSELRAIEECHDQQPSNSPDSGDPTGCLKR